MKYIILAAQTRTQIQEVLHKYISEHLINILVFCFNSLIGPNKTDT